MYLKESECFFAFKTGEMIPSCGNKDGLYNLIQQKKRKKRDYECSFWSF